MAAQPTAPTCLVATLAPPALAVHLAWKNGKHAASLEVQRALGGGSFATLATVGAALNQYQDTTVVAGATYRYQIVAVNGSKTATSGIATITLPGASAPPLVLSLPTVPPVTSPDGNPVVVSFSVSASGGTGASAVVANPASGSAFPVGTTTVLVTATDSADPAQSVSGHFSLEVDPPPVVPPPPSPPPPPPPTPPPPPIPPPTLLSAASLVYKGSIAVPNGTFGHVPPDEGAASFGLAPAFGLAFDPLGHGGLGSLFISSKENLLNVAEISIPTPIIGAVGSLPIATVLQGMADPAEGTFQAAAAGADGPVNRIGGLYVVQDKLIFDAYTFYDANNTQTLTHFTRNRTLATPSVQGPFATAYVRPAGGNVGGFLNGYMGSIPSAWQAALGGTALTGNGALSIISRTSSGPGVFAFTPEALAAAFPAQPLVYYPLEHQTLGAGTPTVAGALFNLADTIHGVAFPASSRTVLFFGTHGFGPWHYGCGVSDPALDGVYNCDTGGGTGCGDYCWYDPANGAKGQHAYPYGNFVWAYDANDFAAVKAGTKQPWDVVPYATWTLTLPYTGVFQIGGVALDAARGLLYIAEVGRQQIGCCTFLPIIHVFQVT
jgi:hypothetical protein